MLQAVAQRADYSKMSGMLRQLTMHENIQRRQVAAALGRPSQHVCAFMRVREGADDVFVNNDCRELAHCGDIYIVDIPVSSLRALSLDSRVDRIEAGMGNTVLTDSMAINLNVLPVYAGTSLQQAYSGKNVVVGIQDIGFDLTHPNFYDSSVSNYRIKRLWDQLSAGTAGSSFYVGSDYTTREALLAYAHSRDGETQTHGTHTLGIAAGCGYNSKYRGIAYDSDICLVANATSDNSTLVDSVDRYKYTYATDVLGFKYIFDYAKSMDKPCVISFSEGSGQDFRGDDVLYYSMLDSLVGPGRIIVSSAGNNSSYKSYFHKPVGKESMGAFICKWGKVAYFTLKGNSSFTIRIKVYNTDKTDTILIPTSRIVEKADSEYVDTFEVGGKRYIFDIAAYTSCYNGSETAYEVCGMSEDYFGLNTPVSLEVVGKDADVEYYYGNAALTTNNLDTSLNAVDVSHNVFSPASAPCVICVGATSYRTRFTNNRGATQVFDQGTGGVRATYSSVGPTIDGRIKPDVMAPGTNVISSISSYYRGSNPKADDVKWDVSSFDFGGRTYLWGANSGTSMSSPAVAGVIALWLQAKPSLTPVEIKDVLGHTCSHYDRLLTYPNNYYGYGQIDAYHGLLYILGLDGISGISISQPSSVKILLSGDNVLNIVFDEAPVKSFNVNVYSVAGALVQSERFSPSASLSYAVNTANLPSGVYAVQVNGGSASTTGSTLIRK